MKKGLTMTLLTVAIAMFGFKAMAEAPVISNIPSPIVGNANDVTAPNMFVYTDAIDLDKFVSDDTSPTAKILWSYDETGGGSKYLLNGINPISATDPTSMEFNPGAKNIAASVGGGEFNPDGNTRTVTIRNKSLSPLGGSTTPPAATGIVATESAAVTLTASDGSSYSQYDLMIYTDNGGEDRLSGDVTVYHPNFGNATHDGFSFTKQFGTVNQGTTGGAICMDTTPMGDNIGMWVGPSGAMPIAANSVYDIVMQMTSSNVDPGKTPFWDMVLDNNNMTGTGSNLYGGDCYFLDNAGGANAAVAAGKTFHMIWAPLAVGTTQWNDPTTGAFRTAMGNKINGRFMFRVMDAWLNGKAGFRADIQSGSICMNDLTVNKYDLLTAVHVIGSPLYSKPATPKMASGTGTTADPFVTGNFCISELAPKVTNVTVASGAIVIAPQVAPVEAGGLDGKSVMYTSFFPGDTNNNYGDPTTQADNFPVVSTANTIYRMSYTIAAMDANSATNPPDCFYINADTPSNEVISMNFVTSNAGACAMPKTTAATYVSFYHTNFQTSSQTSQWKAFRPIFIVANMGELGGSGNNNSGSIKITNYKVEKVTLK